MRLVDIDDIRVMKFLSEEDDPSESDGEREYRNGWNDALTAINDIQPSAEPTEASCWGCNCPKMERMLPSAEPELATDCISRQTAIDAFYKYPNIHWTTLDVLAEIKALPSAEPVRMKGKWVGTTFDGYEDDEPMYCEWSCSACGCVVEDENEKPTWNFCPNCGADMRGEND